MVSIRRLLCQTHLIGTSLLAVIMNLLSPKYLVSAGSYSVHSEESASIVQQFERAGYRVLLHIYPSSFGTTNGVFRCLRKRWCDNYAIYNFGDIFSKYINKNPNNCINKGGKEFKHTSYAYLATSP
jgi:hypothetical protein